jgi:ubiquinone/menaquinone biosynthesis C-methylase UbiE
MFVLDKIYNQSMKELQSLYNEGKNIIQFLKDKYGGNTIPPEIIEMSYDLQTGTYAENMNNNPEVKRMYENRAKEVAKLINERQGRKSKFRILEAGIGEGSFIGELLPHFINNVDAYGFDISWSRVALARNYLTQKGINNVQLNTGDLLNIPFIDNAFDVVCTNQTVEPNHGNEEAILKELYRVASHYVIMIEPAYEFADSKGKKRMREHGYVRNLKNIILSLGMKIEKHELFPYSFHELNPVQIIIIEKNSKTINDNKIYADPFFKTPLVSIGGVFYSHDSLRAYPTLDGIACLRIRNSIIASKCMEYLRK